MSKQLKGQSLFEVLFAIAISAVIVTGVVSLVASSVRNTAFSRNSTLATHYTEQAVEWLRQQRDLDWNFIVKPEATYCLGALSWAGGTPCPIAGTPFSRSVDIEHESSAQGLIVQATVLVTWTDTQGAHESRISTRYSNWQNECTATNNACFINGECCSNTCTANVCN